MKKVLKLASLVLLLMLNISCAQKMMQTLTEAKKLETNKERFICKPLKILLKQIKPKIKMCFGNPENTFFEVNNYISFFFVDKDEFMKRPSATRINVFLAIDYGHPPNPPIKLLKRPDTWTKKLLKEYGDLIVSDIRVSGKN